MRGTLGPMWNDVHFIRENKLGFEITDIEDSPDFKTYEEALEWANTEEIIITRER